MELTIRKATQADVDAVAIMFNQYRVWYGKSADLEEARKFLAERISNNESVIFISFDEKTLTGFAQLYPVFSSMRMKHAWILNDLFVKEEFRGRGFSKALLERAKELCHETGATGFSLETAKTNTIGNKLYPAVGMELNTDFNFYSWDLQ
jgi:ribosomal protein S18 acetylase RimI-like enzyme